MEIKIKDERIKEIKDEAERLLVKLKALVLEKDETLDNMSNSEWGAEKGQRLAEQANRLSYAEMFLDDCVRYLTGAAKFGD